MLNPFLTFNFISFFFHSPSLALLNSIRFCMIIHHVCILESMRGFSQPILPCLLFSCWLAKIMQILMIVVVVCYCNVLKKIMNLHNTWRFLKKINIFALSAFRRLYSTLNYQKHTHISIYICMYECMCCINLYAYPSLFMSR